MKKAFTMIELIFVIVVVGILAAIAIPKFSVTRDDAVITRARNTVASIRSAMSNEVQKRIMQGNYNQIQDLGGTDNAYNSPLFTYFDGDENTGTGKVLEYPIYSCKDASSTGCWIKKGRGRYEFKFPPSIGGSAIFKVDNNHFVCERPATEECKILEH